MNTMEFTQIAHRALNQAPGCTAIDNVGYNYWSAVDSAGNSIVCTEQEHAGWLRPIGTAGESNVASGCQYLALALCIASLIFYTWQYWKATVGWEEVYVVLVEMVKVCIELNHEFDSPATLYLNTGNTVMWIRFGEWLLSCPVILIHLSNITGLKDEYNKRTMMLLVSDLGTIVCGITAALSTTFVKWIFFLMGLCYGCNTYFHAAKVYVEGYHAVPKGICRNIVRMMAWCFFVAWTMFPLLFLFGPEGFKIMSRQGSNIAHTVADMLSKQIWSMLGHLLRNKIHEHIIIHGHITKPAKVTVAGLEVETDQMVDADDEEGINHGTKHLANRESFLIMRDRLQAKGVDCRASFDDHDAGVKAGKFDKMGSMGMTGGASMSLEPGRVILAVPDISMVDFFRQQFASLPAPIEMVPALGAENTVALVQQALQMGGLDCVLVHPEFLRDRTPSGLLMRLRAANVRVVAFGWAPTGPMHELIEGSGVDAYLEGPSFGTAINPQQLLMVLCRMQQAKKSMMSMMGMGMMGGNPMMMNGGMGMMANNGMMGSPMANAGVMAGNNMMMGGMGMGMGANIQMGAMAANNNLMGNNPLYGMGANTAGGAETPLGATTPGHATPPTPSVTPAANATSEADMLRQLMGEIARLKSELGEQ